MTRVKVFKMRLKKERKTKIDIVVDQLRQKNMNTLL